METLSDVRRQRLREAGYYQTLASLHHQLWAAMRDFFPPGSADFPAEQMKYHQENAASVARMARRMLFATL
jgi:hypothetical protein